MGLNWKGKTVQQKVTLALTEAFIDWNLIAEQSIKAELFPGHGYDTGTLNRSVHAESTTYNFAGDNVKRSLNTPERGGRRFSPSVSKKRIAGGLGSGQSYALIVHQGNKSRVGLHFILFGVDKVKDAWGGIIDRRAKEYSDRSR